MQKLNFAYFLGKTPKIKEKKLMCINFTPNAVHTKSLKFGPFVDPELIKVNLSYFFGKI